MNYYILNFVFLQIFIKMYLFFLIRITIWFDQGLFNNIYYYWSRNIYHHFEKQHRHHCDSTLAQPYP